MALPIIASLLNFIIFFLGTRNLNRYNPKEIHRRNQFKSQNSERLSWTFDEVDAKLKNIMINITHNMVDAAKRYGVEGNYVAGANIAGFEKVVDAMIAQGIV